MKEKRGETKKGKLEENREEKEENEESRNKRKIGCKITRRRRSCWKELKTNYEIEGDVERWKRSIRTRRRIRFRRGRRE
jgi:hypothetical protein